MGMARPGPLMDSLDSPLARAGSEYFSLFVVTGKFQLLSL